jgi:hypothetical protein
VSAAKKKAKKLPAPRPTIDTPKGVKAVLDRAEEGDETVLPLVRKLLDRDTREGGTMVELNGNIYLHARDAIIRQATGKKIAIQEAIRQKINAVRDDLAGPNPTALERILCERVALCWFDAHEMDRRYINQADTSLKIAEYRESQRDRAHRRFLAACRTLATVRKLALPAIQVNLAHQQVNIARANGSLE